MWTSGPTLRDQTPLRAHILDKVLTDMSARQWLSARGTRTFQTIEDYPFAERIRGRTPLAAVVELAVSGGCATSPAT